MSTSNLLLNLLSYTKAKPVPLKIISKELNLNKDKLLNCLAYYKKSSVIEIKDIKSQDYSQDEFILYLSKHLNLDENITKKLFILFLQFNYKSSYALLEFQLKSEIGRLDLVIKFEKFYFEEKFFLISSLCYLFCSFDAEDHPYHEIFNDFVAPLYDNYNFIYQIRDQYVFLIESMQNYHKTSNKKLSIENLIENLYLQYKLLELMMLYYRHIVHLPDDILYLFEHFKDQGFGRRLLSKKYFNHEIDNLTRQIGFLQVFIIIEGIGIDSLDERSNEISIINQKYFKIFENLISSLDNNQVNSAIFLCWALVCEKAEVDANIFGMYAIKSNVFEYLHMCIVDKPFSENRNILTFVYFLVSRTLTVFNKESIGDIKNIYEISNVILRQEIIAEDFWNNVFIKENSDGLCVVYEALLNNFPYKMNELLKILISLSITKREISTEICSMLKNMNFFAERLDQSTKLTYQQNTGQNICFLAANKFLSNYKMKDFKIGAGNRGEIITYKQGTICENIILWAFNYDAWNVFTEEIIYFLSLSEETISSLNSDKVQQILLILNFFSTQLHHFDPINDTFTPQFNILLNAAYNIVNRFNKCANVHRLLLESSLEIIIKHARIDPYTTWNQLKSIEFFSKSMNKSSISGDESIYWSLLTNFESANLLFCFSSKILQILNFLVEPLCSSELIDEFISIVILIASRTFPILKNNDSNGDLQLKAIDLFNKTLNSLKKLNKQKNVLRLQTILLDVLLSREASLSLIGIVNIGIDNVGIYKIDNINNPAQLVSSTFALLNSLLYHKPTLSILKTLFLSAIFSRTNSQSLKTIAFYMYDFSDSDLAINATIFLKNLAELYPLSLLSCLGDSAITVRNIILRRLSCSFENIYLKISILDFLTTCLHTQPGLFELFLNENTKDKNNKDLDLLSIIFELIDDSKMSSKENFNIMLTASFEFLHALWKSQCIVIDSSNKKNILWQKIELILFEEDNDLENNCQKKLSYMRLLANIFRIIGLELHYDKKLDKEFLSIVNKLFSSQRILYFSEFLTNQIQYFLSKEHTLNCTLDDESSSFMHEFNSWETSFIQLASAWKEMIVVIAADMKGQIIIQTNASSGVFIKDEISCHIVKGFYYIMSSENDNYRKILSRYFSSLILILSKYWPCESETLDDLTEIYLNLLSNHSAGFLAMENSEAFNYLFSAYTLHIHNMLPLGGLDDFKTLKFLLLSCQLASNITPNLNLMNIDNRENNDGKLKDFNFYNMIRSMIGMICELTTYFNKHLTEDPAWTNCFIESSFLNNLLFSLSNVEMINLDLIITVFTFLLEISKNHEGRRIFLQNNLMNDIFVISNKLDIKKETSIASENLTKERKVFHFYMRIITNLIDIAHFSFSVDFLNSYYDQLVLPFMRSEHAFSMNLIQKFDEMAMEEVITVCRLLNQIGKKEKLHKMPSVYRHILSCMCIWLQNAITLFTQPRLISFTIEQQSTKNTSKNVRTPVKSPSRNSISEDFEAVNPLVIQQQNRILCGISHCLSVLRLISPPLPQLCLDMNFDAKLFETFMNIQFSSSTLEMKNCNLSFNTFISLLNFCVDLMSKTDGARSHSPLKLSTPKSPHLVGFNKPQLLFVIENCMLLICSHGLVNLLDNKLQLKDKNLLKREISSELNSCLLSLQKYLRCGPISPMTPKRQSLESFTPVITKEHPFLGLINMINKQIFS